MPIARSHASRILAIASVTLVLHAPPSLARDSDADQRALGSLVMRAADQHRVPAGSALAVDRDAFAAEVTRAIERHPDVTVVRERRRRVHHERHRCDGEDARSVRARGGHMGLG